jgi:hypothetical protein
VPLDERGHGAPPVAIEEITFPVTRHRPVIGLGRPLADMHRTPDLALAVADRLGVTDWAAHRPPRPQIRRQLLAQRAASLHEQRQVDRLVRHPHLRLVGKRHRQPTRDLPGRPAQLELRLDHRPQPIARRPNRPRAGIMRR